MKKLLHKRVRFYRFYDMQRNFLSGEVSGIVTEVEGQNFMVNDDWYHKKHIYALTIQPENSND